MGRRKNERRTVLVDGRLQARIVLSTSLPMIASLAFAVGAELFVRRQIATGAMSGDATILGMPVHRVGMLLLFVSAAMTQLVGALLVSQKVAGTAYRIRQVLNDFRRGDGTERVKLRKGDYQLQLADDLNQFLDWVAAGGPHPKTDASFDAATARDGTAPLAGARPGQPARADRTLATKPSAEKATSNEVSS